MDSRNNKPDLHKERSQKSQFKHKLLSIKHIIVIEHIKETIHEPTYIRRIGS
jgi:hypothetical protein